MDGEYEVTIDLATASKEELGEFLVDGARYQDEEDVALALEYKANVNFKDASGRTALHMAAANGSLSITTTLLEKSADPEIQNESGNTALHYACLNGHPEVARVLLKYGAKATTVNAADRTPADECLGKASKGHRACAEVLREFTNAARDETAAAEAAGGDEADMEVEVEEMETGEGGQVADGLVSGVEQMGVDEAGSGGGASASAS